MKIGMSRRELIDYAGFAMGAAAVGFAPVAAQAQAKPSDDDAPFTFCLNTGTIRGYNLPLDQQIDVAAKAGYSGIEPWMRDVQKYVDGGGSLADLKKRIGDLGLTVECAIGFARWSVDDADERAKGVEQLKHDSDLVAQLGGRRIAAPPAGSNRVSLDLFKVAERYRTILDAGRDIGVAPVLEIWGSSTTLSRIGEAALVAVEANHPDASLLLDAFHIYRGGSGFDGLRMLNGATMPVFHINDYPADPPRESINDKARVYPGDGVAPLVKMLRTLRDIGFRGALSLELFNPAYWNGEALATARTGLEKTRAVVEKALA